jgi:type IV secretion system protein VirB9
MAQKRVLGALIFTLFLLSQVCSVQAAKPIATDSRIKTFVYSENEVFRVVVHYGYQTSIEFAEGEEIQTISIGNNYAWQLTPVGRRLFIRPLEDNILTNMTIITNMRTYQFEVQSRLMSYTVDEELVYVVRFFYPDNNLDQIKPVLKDVVEADSIPVVKPYNFDYTLDGPVDVAPIRVFDDGINTFFKFPNKVKQPESISVRKGYDFAPMNIRKKNEYFIVNTVDSEFEIKVSGKKVLVYNESYQKR